MRLICLSISHHNTPVELRECLGLTSDMIDSALSKFPIRQGVFEPILEMVFLSTCNRLEIYALVSLTQALEENSNSIFLPILTYLREVLKIATYPIEPYFRSFTGNSTVEHLFQVTAGLDSIAIGETQILGQVSQALENALRCGSARYVLGSFFRSAIHAGKRVRSETEIGRNPISISSIAVQFTEAILGTLFNKQILVIGAGKMGGDAIRSLRENGAQKIILTNRTYQRATELVAKYGVEALPFEHMSDSLKDIDIVFTSTAAAQPILHRELIGEVMSHRPHRQLTLIDLAVPRNVETRVREITNVQLFDMDDLQSYVTTSGVGSHQNIALAKSIVDEEVADYEKLLRVIPFIGELHKKVEHIRQYEVARTLRHLTNPDPEVLEQINLLSHALVRKILHEPTMHLRTETNQETLNDYVDTLARLFDLSEREPDLSIKKEVI
ncbi:MAG: glutamyl-tRNA reductase [Chloroflexi bacterium]|nr:MAG: glutamyl-tRNA reductase [Chloroflexota bacterium]